MNQRSRKGHQVLLAVLEHRQLFFPLPFLLLFLLLDASQTHHLQQGTEDE